MIFAVNFMKLNELKVIFTVKNVAGNVLELNSNFCFAFIKRFAAAQEERNSVPSFVVDLCHSQSVRALFRSAWDSFIV
jgi:hypothetical protein